MDLEGHARHPGGEIEGAGRLVDRVGAEDDEHLDGTPIHGLREIREGPGARLRHGRRVDQGRAGVAEGAVEAVNQRVQVRAGGQAGGDDAASPGLGEGRPGAPRPARDGIVARRGRAARGQIEQIPGEGLQPAGRDHEPPIRLGAGQGRCRRRRVEGEEAALRVGRPPCLAPAPRQADLTGSEIQKVAVQRHDGPGATEIGAGLQGPSIGLASALVDPVAPRPGADIPAERRVGGPQPRELGRHAGRGHGAGEQGETLAPALAPARHPTLQVCPERRPGTRPAEMLHRLGAERVVEPEHRSLGQHVGAAAAPGMLGIALDLQGPAVAGGDQDAVAEAVEHGRGGVGQVRAGHDPLGLIDVRHLVVAAAAPAAGGEAAQREGGGHQLQEAAPLRGRGEPGRRRELGRQIGAELGAVGHGVEAAPEARTVAAGEFRAQGRDVGGAGHRWQIPHSVSRSPPRIWYWATSLGPSVAWSEGGVQVMFQT